MERNVEARTDLLLVFLSECLKLLGELFGLLLPQGLGTDEVLLHLLHLDARGE